MFLFSVNQFYHFLLLQSIFIILTHILQKSPNSKNEGGNKNLNTAERGRTNLGIELSENVNQPESRTQRNLRNDLEAQKRHRENALPINEVNTTAFVAPSNVPSQQISETTRDDVNVQAWNIPTSSSNPQVKSNVTSNVGQSTSKPTVELVRDPNGVRQIYF